MYLECGRRYLAINFQNFKSLIYIVSDNERFYRQTEKGDKRVLLDIHRRSVEFNPDIACKVQFKVKSALLILDLIVSLFIIIILNIRLSI